jgi:hypothetical protein
VACRGCPGLQNKVQGSPSLVDFLQKMVIKYLEARGPENLPPAPRKQCDLKGRDVGVAVPPGFITSRARPGMAREFLGLKAAAASNLLPGWNLTIFLL